MMIYHEISLRKYLLGQLGEAECQRLQEELLSNDSLFETVESLAQEMTLEMIQGKLAASDAALLRSRLQLTEPGRAELAFSRTLNARMNEWTSARRPKKAVGKRRWSKSQTVSALLAALLTLACLVPIAGYIRSGLIAENQRLALRLEELEGRVFPSPLKVTYSLNSTTRSDQGVQQIVVPPQTELVELWLEAPYSGTEYRVSMRSGGQLVYESGLVKSSPKAWGEIVAIEVRSEVLAAGLWELILERPEGDSWTPVASFAVDLTLK